MSEGPLNTASLVSELRGVLVCPSSQRDIMNRAADALESTSRALSEKEGELAEAKESFDKRRIFYLDRMAAAKRDAAELDAISAAIGSVRFMDPPDGGDVSLAEQVRRMAAALKASEERGERLSQELASARLRPEPSGVEIDEAAKVAAIDLYNAALEKFYGQRAAMDGAIREYLRRSPVRELTASDAARILYGAFYDADDLPSAVRREAREGHFFTALRLLFDPDADLSKPPALENGPAALADATQKDPGTEQREAGV
jgi:hypothetical protein